MSTTRISVWTFLLFTVSLTIVVCGGCGSSDHPDLGHVQGTVTIKGQPLADATVTFSPDKGRPSAGTTNSEGEYELTYVRDTKGAILGPHKVRITTVSEEDVVGERRGRRPKEPIPAKYNVRTTLTANVEEGKNTFDFDLK